MRELLLLFSILSVNICKHYLVELYDDQKKASGDYLHNLNSSGNILLLLNALTFSITDTIFKTFQTIVDVYYSIITTRIASSSNFILIYRHAKISRLKTRWTIEELSVKAGKMLWLAIPSFFTLRSAYLVWKEQTGALKDI